MGKLETPAWVLEGYDSKEAYEKKKGIKTKKKATGKTFKVRKCPECGSKQVAVVLTGEEGKGARDWECKKCKWKGKNVDFEEVSEDEFLKLGGEK